MRIRKLLAVLLMLGATISCPGFAGEKRVDHVVIISFDGGKPSVMQDSEMPVFDSMVAEGAHTFNAQTIFPSITLVSHTSMLTGVGPKTHKVLWNDYRVEKGFVTVPTVFSLAKAQGLSTAMFVGKSKFQHLNVPGTVDQFENPDYDAAQVAAQAAKYITEKKPNLCFLHFADGDGAGHKFGWGSPEQITAFNTEDQALKVVKDAIEAAGLKDSTIVLMSADHGGHDKTHGSNRPEDMTIPWVAWGAGVKPGFTIEDAVSTCDTAATALWLLGVDVPAEWEGKPVTAAFAEKGEAAVAKAE